MATPLQQKLTELAQGAAAAHGVQLVTVRFGGNAGRSTLEVLLETPSGESPDVETCAQVSRLLSAQLDVEDMIAGRYTLEVSSAGLDRPLLAAADCARFVGKGAVFKFKVPQMVQGKPLGAVKGVLGATTGEQVTLLVDGQPLTFAFTEVQHAELAPTAAELEAFMGRNPKPVRGTPHPLSARAQKLKKSSPQS